MLAVHARISCAANERHFCASKQELEVLLDDDEDMAGDAACQLRFASPAQQQCSDWWCLEGLFHEGLQ